MIEAPVEAADVAAVQPLENRISPFLDSSAEEEAAEDRRDEAERKISAPSRAKATVHAMGLNRRPSTRCRVKIGRYETMMMMRAKKTGRCTSWAATATISRKVFLCSPKRRVAKNVFDHHDRAVDDHAEVKRAEREQVRGNVTKVEQDGREQQRERNGDGDDQRAADVAQEQETG